jgi:phosphoglycerate dehydrogenase-like enzyme
MKVIVTDEMSKEGLAILTEGSKITVDVKPGISPDDLLKVIGDYDAIIGPGLRSTRRSSRPARS